MKALGCLVLFLAMNAHAQVSAPTVAEAQAFMNKAEAQLADLAVKVNRASWVQEFQFYRALCRESGYKGPLHRCTFYGSKEAGAKFNRMLEMGASKPWPDALEALTGERQTDAGALLEYFAPLKQWLDEQNKGKKEGW
jgi:Angiotensin-converting enzyme